MGLRTIKKDTIAFLMPCGGPVEPRAVQSALNLVSKAALEGFPCNFVGITDRTLIHSARNMLAKGFLEQTDCEWSFWVDSDMVLESRTIPVMMRWTHKLNAKIMTGVYYQRAGAHKPVIWNKEAHDLKGNLINKSDDAYSHFFVYPGMQQPDGKMKVCIGGPPFRVDVSGFGCVLVHRDVIASMNPPYFKFNF